MKILRCFIVGWIITFITIYIIEWVFDPATGLFIAKLVGIVVIVSIIPIIECIVVPIGPPPIPGIRDDQLRITLSWILSILTLWIGLTVIQSYMDGLLFDIPTLLDPMLILEAIIGGILAPSLHQMARNYGQKM